MHKDMVNLSLLILPIVTNSTCLAHLATGVRGLSYGLLGLCVLSCRAFPYPTTQRHTLLRRLFLLSTTSLSFTLRASLYLYNPMVHGPWVGWHYITKLGGQPCDSIILFAPRARNSLNFTTKFGQNLGFEPQNMPWGGFHAHQAPNTNIVTLPWVTLSTWWS